MAPTVRSFSAEFEPLELIEQFPEVYPGLLESGSAMSAGDGARYDILPFASGEHLLLDAKRRLTGPHAGNEGFLSALDGWWKSLRPAESAAPTETAEQHESANTRSEPATRVPFTGGWLVYLGYELASEIEPCLVLPPSSDPVVALALRAPAAWLRDRATGEGWLIAEPGREAMLDEFEQRVSRLREPVPAQSTAPLHSTLFRIDEDDPAKFLSAVRRALEYTAAGDVYQTNLSRQWRAAASRPVSPVAIYQRLRSTNPSPFAAILRYEDFALLSSSPERLVAVREGVVSTRPIAGTRPRGASLEDDEALIRSLLDNDKARAEHVMLIDLERNDLGRVCIGGSVHVDEYMSVETYAHVHHIVSNVSGRLRNGVSPIGVIRALFPGGTITGCPKIRCMQIIAELEDCGRGAYT